MRGRLAGKAVRTWLPLAVASALAAIAAWGLPRVCRTPQLRPSGEEPPWDWNDGARITLCVSKKGASGRDILGFADLKIDGALMGFGDMSRASDPQDTGNVIGCNDYPQRYIEVQDRERETWRIMYALPGTKYPTVHASLGSRVRFRFESTFHSGQTASFLLLDEAGPVIGIEMGGYGPRGLEETDFHLDWGRTFGHRPTGCGGDEVARAIRVVGDTDVSVAPGQVDAVLLHRVRYRFWNILSINVIDGACVDGGDSTSWALWRE